MKKSLLIIALIVIIVGTINVFFGPEPLNKQEAAKQLPWQIEVTPEGNTRVLDIEIGKSTVAEVKQLWKIAPQIALFRSPEGVFKLEAFLGKVKIGPFQARVIFNLEASQAQLKQFAENSRSLDATPSGSHQMRLSEEDFERALLMTIDEMSYSPAVDTEVDMLKNLFGEAEQTIQIDENSRYWLYPKRGLVILVNMEDKEVFHYFPLRNYQQVLQHIEQIKQRKTELPVAEKTE